MKSVSLVCLKCVFQIFSWLQLNACAGSCLDCVTQNGSYQCMGYEGFDCIQFTRLCLKWENDTPNHHDNKHEAKQPHHPTFPATLVLGQTPTSCYSTRGKESHSSLSKCSSRLSTIPTANRYPTWSPFGLSEYTSGPPPSANRGLSISGPPTGSTVKDDDQDNEHHNDTSARWSWQLCDGVVLPQVCPHQPLMALHLLILPTQ